jgi:hypothetical protein
MSVTLDPVQRLESDIRKAAATLGRDEARFLVDQYYALQDFRIQSANQVRSIVKSEKEEPHGTLMYFGDQYIYLEKKAQSALDVYSNSQPLGLWAREHVGVGPVIAAGLLAHIDIERAPYASSIHRFAGLLPGQKKVKGVKRDWNADLKVLCWKLGDSFVKLSNHERCYYGHLYRQRKELEVTRDKNDYNADEAKRTLEEKNIRDKATLATYNSGHLPDGRLDMRARRYAVKRFLTHYFEAAWVLHYGTTPPDPWIVEHGGHKPEHIQPNPFVSLPPIRKS